VSATVTWSDVRAVQEDEMTYQPGEQPSYTPPQDPWSGTQGVASAPTDPIPAPARGQFAPGVAAASAPPPVWQQETVGYDDPYERVGRGHGGRAGMYVLVVFLVLVLGAGGGYGAWWAITKYFPSEDQTVTSGPSSGAPSTDPSTSGDPSPGVSGLVEFRPNRVEVGDCLINLAEEGEPLPKMYLASCDSEDVYEILRIISGEQIPEREDGQFTRQITADPLCQGVAWDAFFGWNHPTDDSQDYFYCLDDYSRP
jgi:hypothetical protein